MPNARVAAAAGGLPSRRTMLITAAALGAALSLPKVARATTPADHPDAALIALAAAAEALAIRSHEALDIFGDLDTKCDRLQPPRPPRPETPSRWDTQVEHRPDGGFTIRQTAIAPDPAIVLAAEEQAAAFAAWEAECAAISDRVGVDAAQAVHDEAYDRLCDAVSELTTMTPTTLAGFAAKARVAVLLDPHDDYGLNDWEDDLRAAVLRDIAKIGGAA